MDKVLFFVPSVNYEEVAMKLKGTIPCRIFSGNIPWDEINDVSNNGKVLVDPQSVNLHTYSRMESKFGSIELVEDLITRQRIIKDETELEKIRTSCRLAAGIVDSLVIEDWKGRTEKELTAYLESRSWENGGSGVSFRPIVASGINSAYPHHFPAEDIIGPGNLKVDFGIVFEEYCSDLTRTFILDKFNSNPEIDRIYSKLDSARTCAVEKLKPGVRCLDVHNIIVHRLSEADLLKYYVHNTGHGVGIDVHEKPYISPGELTELKEGMVVTVEPGVYIPGVGGIRIEDTYLITGEGSERLTRIYQ